MSICYVYYLRLATFGLLKGQVRRWLGVSGAAAVQNVGSHFPLFSDEQRDEAWGLRWRAEILGSNPRPRNRTYNSIQINPASSLLPLSPSPSPSLFLLARKRENEGQPAFLFLANNMELCPTSTAHLPRC
jgi:hypothetical protein